MVMDLYGRKVIRTATTVLIIAAVLSGVVVTACATDGFRSRLPAGAQPFTAGGGVTGQAGATGLVPAASGTTIGRGVNPAGMGGTQLGGSQGTFGTGTGQGGATGLLPADSGATIGRGVIPTGQVTGVNPIGQGSQLGGQGTGGGPSRCVGNACTADSVFPSGQGGIQPQQTQQQSPQGSQMSCQNGVCGVRNPDGTIYVSYGEGKGGAMYNPNTGEARTQGPRLSDPWAGTVWQ